MSVNTTGNNFYENVWFYKGSNAKASLLPNENGKADLGSTRYKFDKLYVNDIPGGSQRLETGTWTPTFTWFGVEENNTRKYNPSSFPSPLSPPTVTTLSANYRKFGKIVEISYYFRYSYTVYDTLNDQNFDARAELSNLPFEIYIRGRIIPFSATLAVISPQAMNTDSLLDPNYPRGARITSQDVYIQFNGSRMYYEGNHIYFASTNRKSLLSSFSTLSNLQNFFLSMRLRGRTERASQVGSRSIDKWFFLTTKYTTN